jgi:signal transduction histidine kinase
MSDGLGAAVSVALQRPIDAQARAQAIALLNRTDTYHWSAADYLRLRAEIIALARQSGDPSVLAEALLWRCFGLQRLEPQAADAALEEARTLYAQQRMAAGLAHCDALRAQTDAAQGRYAQALLTLRRAIPLLGELRNSPRIIANALETMAYVLHMLSMHDELIRTGVAMVDIGRSSGLESALERGAYMQIEGKWARIRSRSSVRGIGTQDDPETAELLAELRGLAEDEQARLGPASLQFRGTLMEILNRLGRVDEAAAVARALPAAPSSEWPPAFDGEIALLLVGPDRCIEMLRPLIEPGGRVFLDSERRDVLQILAMAHERKGDCRAALRLTREALGYSHADASRNAKTQAALLNLELDAERETLRAQQALAHAGKLAAVGQLASSLAHEISQPAAALMLLCDEARAELKAQRWPALAQCLREIEQQAERLRRLVGRMRDFSGDDPVKIEEVSLDQIAEEAHRLLRPKLREAGVACKVEVPALIAMTDRERVILALVNLINNAVDAMRGQRSPAPEVRIVAQQHDSGEVRLSVLDNGPGLSDEVKTKVFQPFFTTKAAGQGLGLGLTITRQALTDLGARLLADNAEGGGARFTVCLPPPARARQAVVAPS